jgi:hypothetical protein
MLAERPSHRDLDFLARFDLVLVLMGAESKFKEYGCPISLQFSMDFDGWAARCIQRTPSYWRMV